MGNCLFGICPPFPPHNLFSDWLYLQELQSFWVQEGCWANRFTGSIQEALTVTCSVSPFPSALDEDTPSSACSEMALLCQCMGLHRVRTPLYPLKGISLKHPSLCSNTDLWKEPSQNPHFSREVGRRGSLIGISQDLCPGSSSCFISWNPKAGSRYPLPQVCQC